MKIPFTKPYFDTREERAVVEVLRSGWVTQGPKVEEFERSVAAYTGSRHAVAVTSATTALYLGLYMFGVKRGDEVLVPSFTFIACANVVRQLGATPVFVDIDPRTYNLDPTDVERKITRRTKAVMAVDQIGLPCDMPRIRAICRRHRLRLLEDAACALGSEYRGKPVGTMGEFTCFSFHPRKNLTTGDGGMMTTESAALASRAKLLRHQGMSVSDVARHKSKRVITERYPEVGFNFRMTDLQAAVGIEQMKKLDFILQKRRERAARYNETLRGVPGLCIPYVPPDATPNWQTYMVRLDARVDRARLMQRMLDAEIATRRGIMATHLEAPYRRGAKGLPLPETERATRETLCLPLYVTMTDREQAYVVDKLKAALIKSSGR